MKKNLVEKKLYNILKDKKVFLQFKKIGLESTKNLKRNLGIKRFGLNKYYQLYYIYFYWFLKFYKEQFLFFNQFSFLIWVRFLIVYYMSWNFFGGVYYNLNFIFDIKIFNFKNFYLDKNLKIFNFIDNIYINYYIYINTFYFKIFLKNFKIEILMGKFYQKYRKLRNMFDRSIIFKYNIENLNINEIYI